MRDRHRQGNAGVMKTFEWRSLEERSRLSEEDCPRNPRRSGEADKQPGVPNVGHTKPGPPGRSCWLSAGEAPLHHALAERQKPGSAIGEQSPPALPSESAGKEDPGSAGENEDF